MHRFRLSENERETEITKEQRTVYPPLGSPFLVKLCVLPGYPPSGGVNLSLGYPDIHAEVYVQYCTTPTLPPSSNATPSSGSKSLCCPTEVGGPKYASQKGRETPGSLSNVTYNPDIPPRPRGPEPSPVAGQQNGSGILPLFPWKCEFSWGSEQLLLDGEEVPTAQPTGALSEDTGAIHEGSSSAGGIATRREFLANLLEGHFWITHPAPQRSDSQNASQDRHSGIATSSRPSNTTAASNAVRARGPSKKSKGMDNGSGDDDDDEDGRDKGTTPRARVSGHTKYFACPFLKWNPPQYFNTCGGRFSNISHVIDHLRQAHYARHSARQKKDELGEGCTVTHGKLTRPDIISEEQWSCISARPKGKSKYESSDQEKRWYRIFQVLFPQSSMPDSAYIVSKQNELMDGLLAYVKRSAVPKLLVRLMGELITGYMSEGASGSGPAQNITMGNSERVGGMTGSPDQSVGNYDTLIAPYHRAMELARLAAGIFYPGSPHILGELSELTEVNDKIGQSGQHGEDCLDLFMGGGNIRSEKQTDPPNTASGHGNPSLDLNGLGTWDGTSGAANPLVGADIASSSNLELGPIDLDNDNPLSPTGGAISLSNVALSSEFPGDLVGFATPPFPEIDGSMKFSEGLSTDNVTTDSVSNDMRGDVDLFLLQWMDDFQGFGN